jgi:DNA polymerase bacteriophage-type
VISEVITSTPSAERVVPRLLAPPFNAPCWYPSMPVITFDFETRSRLDIKTVSTKRYSQDPSTEVLCFAYAIDDGPVKCLLPGDPLPADLSGALAHPECRLAAHSAKFECLIWQNIMTPRFGWPQVSIEQFLCTMGMSLYCGYPRSLEHAAQALNLVEQKDKEGSRLMLALAKYKVAPTPANIERLQAYCVQDVLTERALLRRLVQLPEFEHRVFLHDFLINQRGIPIDTELAIAIDNVVKQSRPRINDKIRDLTGGSVATAGQGAKILKLLAAEGLNIGNLRKPTVKKLFEGKVSEKAKGLLALRAQGTQNAAGKATTLLEKIDDDGFLRDTLVYHGAGPGRWSAQGFQPQNLKRIPKGFDVEAAIAAVKSGYMERVEAIGDPQTVCANLAGAFPYAPPGYEFYGGDYSSVESIGLADHAGETEKLEAYREFFKTRDPAFEQYCRVGSSILKRTVTPDDEQGRSIGKVTELAMGYGGGVRAWRSMAALLGLDDRQRLDEQIKSFVGAWRRAHPRTVKWWNDVDRTLRKAIRRPGERIQCRKISAEFQSGTLRVFLPSGRAISYPEAKIVPGKFEDSFEISFKKGKNWTEKSAWFGVFVENIVQGTCRDLLAEAIIRLEKAGFPVVLTVHDEVLCLVPEGQDRLDEFRAILTEVPAWAEGFPLNAKVWRGKRFTKADAPAMRPQPGAALEPPHKPLNGSCPAPPPSLQPILLPERNSALVDRKPNDAMPHIEHGINHSDIEAAILRQMAEHEIDPPDFLDMDGGFHRFGRKDSCWYRICPDDVVPWWVFGDFSRDIRERGETHAGYTLSAEERAGREQKQEEAQAWARAEKELLEAAAAVEATERWDRCLPAPEDHGYLRKKSIVPCGARIDGNHLLVPMQDINGRLWSIQEISPTGWKSYQPGGRVKGCFYQIGNLGDTFLVGEGFSTCAPLRMATGLGVVAAGNAGNLELVARQLRDKYQEARIIICGDDDWQKRPNVGKSAAEKAAQAIWGGTPARIR